MSEEIIEQFYGNLLSDKRIHGVLLYKDSEVIKSNLDDSTTEQFINFAGEIFKKAEESLKKLPEMTGEVNYVTIYLQNNVVVLVVKYNEYGLVLVAKTERVGTEEINDIIEKIKDVIKTVG